jgi:transcriptional regulator with XRE-family HTH domain
MDRNVNARVPAVPGLELVLYRNGGVYPLEMLAVEWRGITTALGATVRELRELLGWSQQELANRAVVSQGTISRIEAGTHAGLPFHSVVVVGRSLAAGAAAVKLAVSPVARSLLNFVVALDHEFSLIEPMDPQLVKLVRAYQCLTPGQRAALADFVTATVALEAVHDHTS